LEHAKMVRAPAPKTNKKNSFHLLHDHACSAESVIYAQH
jgi:hypothetical protein